jgi:hypothetical protein
MALWKDICEFFANFNHTLVVCVEGFYNAVCFSLNTTFLCIGLFVCRLGYAG